MNAFWDLVAIKNQKRDHGECYCKEEKAIDKLSNFPTKNVKCIFCLSEFDDFSDELNDKLINHDVETGGDRP